MSKNTESQRHLHKLLAKQVQPHLQFQDLVAKHLQPHLQFQELIDKHLQPHLQFQELIDKHLQPHLQFQELIDKHLQPQLRFQELIDKHLQPHLQFQELIDKHLQPHLQFQELINKQLKPQQLLNDNIGRYLKPLNNYLSDPLIGSIDVSEDGTITVSNQTVGLDVIQENIDALAGEYSGPQEFLERLFSLFNKLGRSSRVVIIYIFLPYLISIFANLTTPTLMEWSQEYTGHDRRTAKKGIIHEARELFSIEELSNFRFVYASILNVRQCGSLSSEIIGQLYIGKTVKLIEKSKSWSLIEYQDDESGEIKMGWVFSRYLEKFNK